MQGSEQLIKREVRSSEIVGAVESMCHIPRRHPSCPGIAIRTCGSAEVVTCGPAHQNSPVENSHIAIDGRMQPVQFLRAPRVRSTPSTRLLCDKVAHASQSERK